MTELNRKLNPFLQEDETNSRGFGLDRYDDCTAIDFDSKIKTYDEGSDRSQKEDHTLNNNNNSHSFVESSLAPNIGILMNTSSSDVRSKGENPSGSSMKLPKFLNDRCIECTEQGSPDGYRTVIELRLQDGDFEFVQQHGVCNKWLDGIMGGDGCKTKNCSNGKHFILQPSPIYSRGFKSRIITCCDKESLRRVNNFVGSPTTILCKNYVNCTNSECKFAHSPQEIMKGVPRVMLERIAKDKNWKKHFIGFDKLFTSDSKDATFLDEMTQLMWNWLDRNRDQIEKYEIQKDTNGRENGRDRFRNLSREDQLKRFCIPDPTLDNLEKLADLVNKWYIGIRKGTEIAGKSEEYLSFDPAPFYPTDHFRNEIVELFIAGFNFCNDPDCRHGPQCHKGLCHIKQNRDDDMMIMLSLLYGESPDSFISRSISKCEKSLATLQNVKESNQPSLNSGKNQKENYKEISEGLGEKIKGTKQSLKFLQRKKKMLDEGKLFDFSPHIPTVDKKSDQNENLQTDSSFGIIRVVKQDKKVAWKHLLQVQYVNHKHQDTTRTIIKAPTQWKLYYDSNDWRPDDDKPAILLKEKPEFIGEYSGLADIDEVWGFYEDKYYIDAREWTELIQEGVPTFKNWCEEYFVQDVYDDGYIPMLNRYREKVRLASSVPDEGWTISGKKQKEPKFASFMTRHMSEIDGQRESEEKEKVRLALEQLAARKKEEEYQNWLTQTKPGRIYALQIKIPKLEEKESTDEGTPSQKRRLSSEIRKCKKNLHSLIEEQKKIDETNNQAIREADEILRTQDVEMGEMEEFKPEKPRKLSSQEQTKLKKASKEKERERKKKKASKEKEKEREREREKKIGRDVWTM